MHITADPAKGINKRADECTWVSGRRADPLQLMGQLVCLKRTWSVCLVNHVTFLLQAKNSKVKCVDKPGVRAYLRKLSPSPGAICDIKVYCTDSLNKRIHWQGLLEISEMLFIQQAYRSSTWWIRFTKNVCCLEVISGLKNVLLEAWFDPGKGAGVTCCWSRLDVLLGWPLEIIIIRKNQFKGCRLVPLGN